MQSAAFPGALPAAGGLREQPARLMETMTEALSLYRAITQYQRVPAGARVKWLVAHPDLADARARARSNGWIA